MAGSLTTDASSMERMKKLLSPGSRKKPFNNTHKTFGVPLEDLLNRLEGRKVPYIVSRICEHIQYKGFENEGIFRVNGSTRIVEKLRTSFDQRGDADFEEEEDLMAVAGLLKLFLRELPGALIPEHRTKQFVSIQEVYMNDPESCIHQLKEEIKSLPEENYNLLKYLIRFLVVIAHFEKKNKMHAMALAIVFGPNVFKCGQGIIGLKDQGTVNQIVYKFIVYYDQLFKEQGEETPLEQWIKRKQKGPPRPPPPKFHVEEYKPTPSPRINKVKHDTYDSSHYQEHEEQDRSDESSSHTQGKGSNPSPMFSDDELGGRASSPFILDSDGGYSIIESPVPSARTTEAVGKAISQTITEKLFGDDISLRGSQDFIGLHNGTADTEAHIETTEDTDESKENIEECVPVKDRVWKFEGQKVTGNEVINKPVKQQPSSAAFQLFESKGLIITQVPKYLKQEESHQSMEEERETAEFKPDIEMETGKEDEFETVTRDSATLSMLQFKKPSGPKNRRSPSRRSRSNSEEKDMEEGPMETTHDQNDNHVVNGTDVHHGVREEYVMPPQPKPRIAFLELTNNRSENRSPDTSPNSGRKPFIPPLDLSTLHEHIDSSDPILAHKGQSVSYQRAKSHLNGDEATDVVISPRNTKLIKRKSNLPMNTDVAPSPPVEQEHFKKHITPGMDDEITLKLKQQAKKIHTLKKKLKHFEETFEKENGYKPSQADKANKPTVKKWMNDLSKAKREIKRLKEEAEIGSRSRHGSGASSSGERLEPPDLPPTMSHTLDLILKRLDEKRSDSNRPENIEMMTRDQVHEEKLAVQKALLHFENIHGRPKIKEEKDLMRPLYDRYRTIKRIIAKPMSPREKNELQIIHEDQELNADVNYSKPRIPVHVPTANYDEEEVVNDNLGTMEFAVTRDFSLFRDTMRPLPKESKQSGHSPKVKRKLEMGEEENMGESNSTQDLNLHEMSIPELQDEFIRAKAEKKRLRRTLRTFEENFFQKNGRRVQKEDREPLQEDYNTYKQIKAKLKLLEALLSKYQQSSEA